MNKRYFIAPMLIIAAGCGDVSNGGESIGESARALITTGDGSGGACNARVWACGPDAGCPNGPSYVTGDIVLYQPNGQYYQATHDNGGLDPTVSTWYWSPTTCSSSSSSGSSSGGGGGGGSGIAGVVSQAQFEQWFPNRNPFYTYAGLTSINNKYPDFANSSDMTIRKREVAALLANVSHETGDLVYVVEQNTANHCSYCDSGQPFGCPAGQCKYYGRGPLQLSWNYNYKTAGDALGYDLLNNPNLAESDASISWQTAAWFWNTQTGAGFPTPHDAMLQSSGAYGFGYTIRVINGGRECTSMGGSNTTQRDHRIQRYQDFCDLLAVSYGDNLSC